MRGISIDGLMAVFLYDSGGTRLIQFDVLMDVVVGTEAEFVRNYVANAPAIESMT